MGGGDQDGIEAVELEERTKLAALQKAQKAVKNAQAAKAKKDKALERAKEAAKKAEGNPEIASNQTIPVSQTHMSSFSRVAGSAEPGGERSGARRCRRVGCKRALGED